MNKKNTHFDNYFRDIQILFILAVAAIFLWTIALGNLPLRDWDEGYYGTVAKDMFRTGNWLYPTYLGEPFLLKPPLIFWLISLSYHLGGINEFMTRLPGALLTAFAVPLLYLIGREIFSHRLPAILSASVYLTLLPIVRHGRLAMLDGMINSFFLLSLFCLLKGRQNPRWLIGAGIGLVLVALSKGILVIALAVVLVIFLLVNQEFKLLKSPYLWLGIILGFAPVIAWYLLQIQHYGNNFIQVHFQAQSFDRLSTAVAGNKGAIWYYLVELIKYPIPWLLFFPGSLYLAWQNREQAWANLVLIGTGIYLVIISLMGTKLPWYIMPVYPFFALAVGSYLAYLWQNSQRYSPTLGILLGILGIAALGGGVYFVLTNPQPSLILMAIVLGITLILAAGKIRQNQPIFIPILIVGLYTTLGLFFVSQDWIWELNEAFSVKPVAALIQSHTPSDTVVYTSFAYSRPSLDFYSDRKIIAVDMTSLKQLTSQQSYLLLDQPTLDHLQLVNSLSLGTAEGFTLVMSQPNTP